MNAKVRTISETIVAIFFSCAVFVGTAEAKIVSPSSDIVVYQPTDLPELAQRQGLAFELYSGSGDGGVYLYVEQHHGERLVVLDVTDSANIKMAGTATLNVPGPFDFVRPLGSSAILVRFRNNLGVAVLDLRKAKSPVLKTVSGLQYPGHTESLGQNGFLMENVLHVDAQMSARDYQVVDTANPADPALVYTAKQVTHKLTRDETGTTFLLGSEGLTIIRLPRAEEDYRARQNPAY
jgi:hypothetical protein